MPPIPTPEFEFLLFEGFSNMVLANAMEPLRDVKMRAIGAETSWRVSTLDGAPVASSSGLRISPDGAFDPEQPGRRLVLVSGYQFERLVTPVLSAQLRQAARKCHQIIAVDAAAWLLASAGLLQGHVATAHWQMLDQLQEAFPDVEVSTEPFVASGRFLTCGGASTALDMMLDLIHKRFGAAAAFGASSMFLYNAEGQSALQRGARRLRETAPAPLLAALDLMADNIETPLISAELARRVGTSERSLNRLFLRDLQIAPGKYYQMLRLERARSLALDTHLSLEQIAPRCGFASAASLSRAIRKAYGVSVRNLDKAKIQAPDR